MISALRGHALGRSPRSSPGRAHREMAKRRRSASAGQDRRPGPREGADTSAWVPPRMPAEDEDEGRDRKASATRDLHRPEMLGAGALREPSPGALAIGQISASGWIPSDDENCQHGQHHRTRDDSPYPAFRPWDVQPLARIEVQVPQPREVVVPDRQIDRNNTSLPNQDCSTPSAKAKYAPVAAASSHQTISRAATISALPVIRVRIEVIEVSCGR
jgi:hypothetical protein